MPAQTEPEPREYCPRCGAIVDYGCLCWDRNGEPTFPLVTRSGAQPALDRAKARERLLKAAVVWAYDKSCSEALMELDDAVERYIGTPIDLPLQEQR